MSKRISSAISAFCACMFVFAVGGCLPGEFVPGASVLDTSAPVPKDEPTNQTPTHRMTLTTEGEGTAWMEPADGVCPENSIVTLHATPASGWRFKCWKTSDRNVELWFQILWQPAVVVMCRDKTAVACFEKIPSVTEYTLAATPSGNGTVMINPSGSTFTAGATVTVEAQPASGWHFDHWEGDLTGTTNPGQIAMNANKNIVAVFAENPHSQVALPNFTPQNGTSFATSLSVEMNSLTPQAVIHYTTDGSDPSESSATYTGAITITSSTTFKARAFKSGMTASTITSSTYVLAPRYTLNLSTSGQGTVSSAPNMSAYDPNATVQITASPVSGWYFDHWEGDVTGTANPTQIAMNANKSVTAVFVADSQVASPVISPNGGSLSSSSVSVMITCPTPGATIRYTLDGSSPTETSSAYTGPLSLLILSSKTVKARAFKSGMTASTITSSTYVLAMQYTLNLSTSGQGTVSSAPNTTMFDPNATVQITASPVSGWHFDHWSGDVTGSSNPATITMSASKNVTAVFVQDTTATPTFSPADGTTFTSPLTVTVTCATPGATIYYTVDGSDPVDPNSTVALITGSVSFGSISTGPYTSSILYTGPFPCSSTTTVKARAFGGGMIPSAIASATYTRAPQVDTPTIEASSTDFVHSLDIVLSTTTSGTSIYYTLDGTDPSESSTPYSGSFYIESTTTVKARAYKSGMYLSNIATATFTQVPPGTLQWSFTTSGPIVSSPAVGLDGTVYVGSFDSYLYAINSDGSEKWRFQTGSIIASSPTVGPDGTVYIGSSNNNLYALDPNTGTQKWAYATSGVIEATAAIGWDGTIYVGSADNKIHAVNSSMGTAWWTFTTGGVIGSSPVVGTDGVVYAGSADGYVYALYPDGALKWKSALLDGEVDNSPAIDANGVLYVGTANTLSGNSVAGRTLYAFDTHDGTIRWQTPFPGSLTSSPAIGTNGMLVVGNDTSGFYAVDPNTGTILFSYGTGAPVYSSPAVTADGVVYFGSDNFDIYALHLDPSSFTNRWSFTANGAVRSSPTIGQDGTVYVGSEDGKLYALYGASSLAYTSWPMFQHDPQHTGRGSTYNPPPIITGITVLSAPQESVGGTLTLYCSVTSEPDEPISSVVLDLTSVGGASAATMTYNSTTQRWEYSGFLSSPGSSGPRSAGITAYDMQGASGHQKAAFNVKAY